MKDNFEKWSKSWCEMGNDDIPLISWHYKAGHLKWHGGSRSLYGAYIISISTNRNASATNWMSGVYQHIGQTTGGVSGVCPIF